MQITGTSTDHIDRAMHVAERIAIGIAYTVVGLSVATAFAVFALTNFVQF